jgi:hypothetical protein
MSPRSERPGRDCDAAGLDQDPGEEQEERRKPAMEENDVLKGSEEDPGLKNTPRRKHDFQTG